MIFFFFYIEYRNQVIFLLSITHIVLPFVLRTVYEYKYNIHLLPPLRWRVHSFIMDIIEYLKLNADNSWKKKRKKKKHDLFAVI